MHPVIFTMMKLFYYYKRPYGFYKLDNPINFEQFSLLLKSKIKIIKDNKIVEFYNTYLTLFEKYPSFSKTNLNITIAKLFNLYPHNTNILFWKSRGFTDEESAEELSKRQSTFSITSIMKTFNVNEQEALKIFNDRKRIMVDSYKNHKDYNERNKKKAWLNIECLMNKINPDTGKKYSYNEANEKINLWKQQHSNCISQQWIERQKTNNFPIFNTNIQYYLNLGYNYNQAKQLLTQRQQTRLLSRMIKIYGESEGLLRYNSANLKYKTTMENKSDDEKYKILLSKFPNNKFYSNSSFLFFEKLKSVLIKNNIDVSNMKYGNNEYFIYSKTDKKIYFYDCKIYNILIEYNGSHVHPNINMTQDNWDKWKHVYTKKSADEVYELDKHKIEVATSHGNEVYTVWDIDDEDEQIEKLLSIIQLKGSKQ